MCHMLGHDILMFSQCYILMALVLVWFYPKADLEASRIWIQVVYLEGGPKEKPKIEWVGKTDKGNMRRKVCKCVLSIQLAQWVTGTQFRREF